MICLVRKEYVGEKTPSVALVVCRDSVDGGRRYRSEKSVRWHQTCGASIDLPWAYKTCENWVLYGGTGCRTRNRKPRTAGYEARAEEAGQVSNRDD